MNGLLPIIRRVRRPLLPVDERAASVPLAVQSAAGLQPADGTPIPSTAPDASLTAPPLGEEQPVTNRLLYYVKFIVCYLAITNLTFVTIGFPDASIVLKTYR